MKKAFWLVILVAAIAFCGVAHADRINIQDFSTDTTLITFTDIQNTSSYFGNAALSPITQYQNLGVTYFVHNDSEILIDHPEQDVFRLGGFVEGQGKSIATNVGDGASIELIFYRPVYQIGALIAVSNASLEVYGHHNNLLEQYCTSSVYYNQINPNEHVTEYIGIEHREQGGIYRAVFRDITENGLILSIDDVRFAGRVPVPEPSTVLLLAIGIAGFGIWKRQKLT